MFNSRYKSLGFTLIELMITLVIVIILTSIALPSFRSMIVSNNIITTTNELVATVNYARSEAIRRGKGITICKSSSGTGCLTGGGTYWDSGWIAFVDTANYGTHDAGEEIIRVWSTLPTGYTLRPNNNFINYLRYDPHGAANNIGTFAICHDSSEVGAKAIVITRLRPRLGGDSDNDQIPEKDNGSNISTCESP